MVGAIDDLNNNNNNNSNQLVAKKALVITNYEGRRYSCSEYSARWILGALALIFSCGLAYLSKDVVQLFAKSKKVEPLQISNDPAPTPVEALVPKEDKPEPAVKEEIKQVAIPIRLTEPNIPLAEPKKEEVVNTLELKVEIQEVKIESEVELDQEKKMLLEQFTPEMVEALGGIDVVFNLPFLVDWDGKLDVDSFKAPIMRGCHAGDPFLIFCYLKGADSVCEYLKRDKVKGWEGVPINLKEPRELHLGFSGFIKDKTEEANYMFDKIKRLIGGEAIGQTKKYPKCFWRKPEDIESIRPKDALLEGDELTAFMQLEPLFYERKPQAGTTDLFLWDPSISDVENRKQLFEKFPAMMDQYLIEIQPLKEDPEKKLLLEQFTPQMVEALGGIDAVFNLPVLENWDGNFDQKYLTAPVMRGSTGINKPFLMFCYSRCAQGQNFTTVCEYLGKRNGKNWVGVCEYDTERQLDLRSQSSISDDSEEAKYMLDKIRRLMKGEPVGQVKKYIKIGFKKPNDLESIRPNNAFLEKDELTAFMKLDPIFYERKPKEGTTELFLWDPKKTRLENKERLKEKFPEMV